MQAFNDENANESYRVFLERILVKLTGKLVLRRAKARCSWLCSPVSNVP
jgi:hypothetical protein